jgi:ABC-type transport system involved in cytochrome c biogenesis ATPase subunit
MPPDAFHYLGHNEGIEGIIATLGFLVFQTSWIQELLTRKKAHALRVYRSSRALIKRLFCGSGC